MSIILFEVWQGSTKQIISRFNVNWGNLWVWSH